MILEIINKVSVLLLVLSILNVIRHSFFLVKSLKTEEKFILSDKRLILLGISIAYIVTCISTGFYG